MSRASELKPPIPKALRMMREQPKVPVRVVVCAACRYGELLVCSARHHDPVMNAQIKALKEADEIAIHNHGDYEQGFIDQWGKFMNREEVLTVAIAAAQINVRRPKTFPETELFSEDLY